MAGEGLPTIKRRIKSVNNTKKITKAIGLVTTSKFKKVREGLSQNNEYYSYIKEIIMQLLQDICFEKNNIYINDNKSNKKLYLCLTSNSGLCGGFNINIVTKVMEYISKDRENSKVIIVGKKGKVYLKKFNVEFMNEFTQISDVPIIEDIKNILNRVLDLYLKEEIGEINIVYTKFISSAKQEVKVEKVLPFSQCNSELKDLKKQIIEYEPEQEELFTIISRTYLEATLLNFMLNSRVSEEQARMITMDAATKNANDLLNELNIRYNRIRQNMITQEISEIVGGAEAQK